MSKMLRTYSNLVRLPGLIDVHVHIREPGNRYKGDWRTETMAALAGGITTVCVMPNTSPAIINESAYNWIDEIANENAYCDYGIYVGANDDNYNDLHNINAVGMKMYLDNTFGSLLLNDWRTHMSMWPENKPICIHSKDELLEDVIMEGMKTNKKVHICHVAKRWEIELIKKYKDMGYDNLTCEVCPHHLFLTNKYTNIDDQLKSVKPDLPTIDDQLALWENMDVIDVFATDHAPHTIFDKYEKHCPGFPGLETALPLLLTAVKYDKLTLGDITQKYHTNPIKIFDLDEQPDTYIEVDMDKEWRIPYKMKFSKCGWTPFMDTVVYGEVVKVVLRDNVVYEDGEVMTYPGYGINVVCDKKPKDILSICQYDRNHIDKIFDSAIQMRNDVIMNGCINILNNKVLALMFMEPSTRTRCSFDTAMKRLGGNVIPYNVNQSSSKKGETLEDSARCLSCYCDAIVLRSPIAGSAQRVSNVVSVPVINAGDGTKEHPTQALLDGFTIMDEMGKIDGLTITMVGDLKHGRTVHSLSRLLSNYDVTLRFVSPPSLRMPHEVIQDISVEYSEHTTIEEVLDETDVLYVTRIQKERFVSVDEYDKVKECYIVTPELLQNAKLNMVVLHPLPRINEIVPEVDADPRAAYFRQMKNGLYVRMALLMEVFGETL